MKKFLGENILIRTFEHSDVRLLFEAVTESISEISKWMPWCHPDYSLEESLEWVNSREHAWKNGIEYSFVIEHKNSGIFLGGVGINEISLANKFGNLGYWMRTKYSGNGFTTEAAKIAVKFAFEELNLNRIEIVMAKENISSRRVAEKLNAQKEGIARKRLVIKDQIYDANIFSLIKEDNL
jgi:ribosomal-protein-serine acetyltransferase